MSSRRQNMPFQQQTLSGSSAQLNSSQAQNMGQNSQYQQLLIAGSSQAPQQTSSFFPPIENLQQFRQQLMMSLAKYSDSQTTKQASDELKELMTEHITNTDRMNAFLLLLQEHNEHMKPNHKKELIRLYGNAAEIFEDALLPFVPKILAYLQRKLKENDALLHGVISESLGSLVHQVFKKSGSLDELLEQFNPITKLLFSNLSTPNRQLQVGSAICLTRVIQNAPVIVLQTSLPSLTQKILEVLSMNTCKCQTQLLESLISLILAVENDFGKYSAQFLPTLLECMTNNDWQVRKMAIDVIYTMAAILREAVAPFKGEILDCLNHSRSDKNKPVREATIEAIQAVKDIPDSNSGQQQQKQEQTNLPQTFKRPPTSQNKTESSKTPKYARELSPQFSTDSLAQNSRLNQNSSTTSLPKKSDSQRNGLSRENFTSQRELAKTYSSRSKARGQGNQSQTNRSKVNDETSKSDIDNGTQNLRKTLTSATRKKIARQSEANLPTTKSQMSNVPKESILRGPRNNGFFSKHQHDEIEIYEGQKPQSRDDEDEEYESVQDQNNTNDVQIKIYEGKKLSPYQDNSSQKVQIQNQQQDHQNSSHKKISPIKKNFLENNDLLSERKLNYQQDGNANDYSPSQNDRSYISSSQNNQLKYQQPKQAWQKQSPNQAIGQNQQSLLLSGNKSFINNQYQNEFMNFNPPHSNNQVMLNHSQLRQPIFEQLTQDQQFQYIQQQPQILTIQQPTQIPQPVIQSNDQQIQFLIQELQKMHQNQTIMMEKMNDYQNSQKSEVFSLQARIAKLEDIINIQNQQNQMLQSQVLNSQVQSQSQLMGYINPLQQQQQQQNLLNAQTQAISNAGLSQSFTLSQDNTQNIQNMQNQQQQNHARSKWAQTQNGQQQNSVQQNKNSLWQQIQDQISGQNLNQAFQLLLQNDLTAQSQISQDDRDLLLIKLIGKTGVCLEKLDNLTIDSLLNRIISILSQKEFIDVLLPWLSQITQYFSVDQNSGNDQFKGGSKMDLNSQSNLIECLLLLLSDTSSDNSNLNDHQRSEIEQIYLSMSQNMKS